MINKICTRKNVDERSVVKIECIYDGRRNKSIGRCWSELWCRATLITQFFIRLRNDRACRSKPQNKSWQKMASSHNLYTHHCLHVAEQLVHDNACVAL